jgi:signal transduction histidine kinase
MQGRTAAFSTFSEGQFDEAAFEAQLTGDRMKTMTCLYWILKLKARFLSGDYAEALAAAGKAKPVLWGAAAQIHLLDYSYYTALAVAALYASASGDQQAEWHGLLDAHLEQLREWADNYPPTFGDKHALVSAEVARLEGRDADAMRLYEDAIRSAHENGFVQCEGLAHEVAARFYAARGFETIAHAYLRNARHCYLCWGALGKVRQLEQRHPRLREEPARAGPAATIGADVEHLDLDTVVKASQAVSGEIELGKLIETLMRIAVEHAGAERGLLIITRNGEPRIEAEANSGRGTVEVTLRLSAVTRSEVPEAVLRTVIRTRGSVILDDASAQNPFSADGYFRDRHSRSVLCLPLLKQTKLIGVLYLENNLTPRAFTSDRLAVLNLLASQAAISLENAWLYADLRLEITERKHAQGEREQLEQRLRQAEKMEAVGRLAAGIAHDFNNVLAGVFAYGEMLIEETPEQSPLKRYAKNVLIAAMRGRALVEQILAYSRSQLGKRAPLDIGQVVAETLELLHGSLPAAIRLEASAPQLPLVVIGDATQLHQVVMNLCSNAIQAMSEGGTLRVALEAAELPAQRTVSNGTLRPGPYVRLTVEDSGSGMDAATLAHIFEPFFTTKEIGRGTGLGLSLVYAIVGDAGGAIDVRSILRQGSTFTIYLPRTQDLPVAAEETANPFVYPPLSGQSAAEIDRAETSPDTPLSAARRFAE